RRLRGGIPLGAVAAVLVGILVASWVGLPNDPLGPGTATAAEVQARVARAFATVETLEGTLASETAQVRIPEGATGELDSRTLPRAILEQEFSFATTSAGDFALDAADGSERQAYAAADGTLRSVSVVEGSVFALEDRNTGVGPPDGAGTMWLLKRSLGSVVRAFLAERTDAPVETVEHEGREAWHLSIDVDPTRYELTPDHLDITVDRQTGFPVEVTETRAGELVQRIRLRDLAVDRPIDPARFRLEFPPGARVGSADAGFRRVAPEEAAAALGYQPPVPASVPDGYEHTAVAVAGRSRSTGAEGMNPESRDVFGLSSRRGLDALTVTSRRTGDDPSAWTDPITAGEGSITHPATIRLRTGRFRGVEAELVVEPGTPPHLWLRTDDLVVTVAGDVTREELIRIAESF
ncbi:MAG: hypothetical protein ACRDKW_15765, partial [Actinomycetota bacterium]